VKFAIDAGAPYVSADLGRAESANEALDRAHHEIELARQTVALRSDVREAYETWQADIHDVELSLDYFDKLDRLDHNPAERGLERGEYIDEELPLRELEDRMTHAGRGRDPRKRPTSSKSTTRTETASSTCPAREWKRRSSHLGHPGQSRYHERAQCPGVRSANHAAAARTSPGPRPRSSEPRRSPERD
jgi:hypothetical protein